MLQALIDLIFPPLCHTCRKFMPDAGRIHICPECRATSGPLHSPMCTCCGVPFITHEGIDHRCGRCTAKNPHFDAARSAVLYEGAVRDLIHRLKYDGRVQCRRPLGLLMAERLAGYCGDVSPDLMVPVPLHLRRLRTRGFNQSVLIGELVAKEWHLPFERRVLRRTRWTESQLTLKVEERAANVRGAFEVAFPDRVRGKRVMLVDDVLTTGSTANECARVLTKAGAASVCVVTVARVPSEPGPSGFGL